MYGVTRKGNCEQKSSTVHCTQTMMFENAGAAYIYSYAFFNHARDVPGTEDSVVFDVAVPCATSGDEQSEMEKPVLVCSLRVLHLTQFGDIQPGLYHIFAKVVQFIPDIHPSSPKIGEDMFALIGEVIEINPSSGAGFQQIGFHTKPARFTVSGQVIEIEKSQARF
ncbi:hypothetical protein EI94DRAFT_1832644 [Lactarius quietus]|nr:hypothetical protein EI94DRAFT_1832644 [Lactarius quietus]